MIDLSRYGFETLLEDEEFAFCRGRRDDGELPTILLVAPVSEHPVPGILERLEHEYSLRDELDSDWAARPLTLARREGRPMLILEDPGGEPLDRLLGQPMELGRFLRFGCRPCSCAGQAPSARAYPQGYQAGQHSGELRERRGLVDRFRYCFPSSARTPVGRTT